MYARWESFKLELLELGGTRSNAEDVKGIRTPVVRRIAVIGVLLPLHKPKQRAPKYEPLELKSQRHTSVVQKNRKATETVSLICNAQNVSKLAEIMRRVSGYQTLFDARPVAFLYG
jgi:hypothetical protein